jgi:hypothetical protein
MDNGFRLASSQYGLQVEKGVEGCRIANPLVHWTEKAALQLPVLGEADVHRGIEE